MTIDRLLFKIQNKEIKEGTIFYISGSWFYKMIVIDKTLYFINEIAKELKPISSENIGKMLINEDKIYQYKVVME